MAEPRPRTFPAPVKGIEWRENYQEEAHAEILLNADLSRGYLESRQGFSATALPAVCDKWVRLHATNFPGQSPNVLIVGLSSTSGNTSLYAAVADAAGNVVRNSDQVLTTGLSADIDNFRCSFVDHTIPEVCGKTQWVTLIATSVGHFVYDPLRTDGDLFRAINPASVDSSGDALRINDLNFAYYENLPPAYIMCEHQGRIYRAGYSGSVTGKLSRGIEADQTLIPEGDIRNRCGNRDEIALAPHHVTHSDEFDPAAVQGVHVWSVEEREVVTGLKSFQEKLVVFTDRSIYVTDTGLAVNGTLQKLVSGVGCVAHNSIVEVQGVLYFLSKDGIYAWQGGVQVQKLTAPIDELWTGRYKRTWRPAAMDDALTDLGWPFKVAQASTKFCNVMHYQTRNQIWWSIPIQGRAPRNMALTLVWDYVHNAWSFYVQRPKSNTDGEYATCMYDGLAVRLAEGEETVLTTSNVASNGLQTYGGDRTDAGSGDIGIPLIWLSGRLWKGNVRVNKRRPVRFNLLSTGKSPATNPPVYVLVGEQASYIDPDPAGATDTEQSATLSTHPGLNQTATTSGFWNTMRWAASGNSWFGKDWFWSKNEGSVKSRSVRVGIVDDADDQDRGPMVVMQAFAVESEAGGDTR